jgi:protein-disulfide isomerase
MERLKASLQDSEIESKIRQDEDDGRKLGVLRTYAFFVNGKMLHELGYEQLRSAIEGSLK